MNKIITRWKNSSKADKAIVIVLSPVLIPFTLFVWVIVIICSLLVMGGTKILYILTGDDLS